MYVYSRRNSLFSSRKRMPLGRWIVLILVLVIALLGVFVSLDNGRIVVKTQRVFVSNLPSALEGFTVLHISDLNGARFGPGQKQLVNALKNRKYSAVCITGDMVGPKGDAYAFNDLLAALDSTKPVFFIAGDSDPEPIGGQAGNQYTVFADWVLTAQQTHRAIFLGAPASIQVGSATVWFSDASQLTLDLDTAIKAYEGSTSLTSVYYAEVVAQTQAARKLMKEEDLHIVLSHNPTNAESMQRIQNAQDPQVQQFARSVDLIVSGGAVGGQWRLPFTGPVWYEGWFPDESTMDGYHYAGALLEYTSAGLGTNARCPLPGFRLFNTPQVTLLTFTSGIEDGVLPSL